MTVLLGLSPPSTKPGLYTPMDPTRTQRTLISPLTLSLHFISNDSETRDDRLQAHPPPPPCPAQASCCYYKAVLPPATSPIPTSPSLLLTAQTQPLSSLILLPPHSINCLPTSCPWYPVKSGLYWGDEVGKGDRCTSSPATFIYLFPRADRVCFERLKTT